MTLLVGGVMPVLIPVLRVAQDAMLVRAPLPCSCRPCDGLMMTMGDGPGGVRALRDLPKRPSTTCDMSTLPPAARDNRGESNSNKVILSERSESKDLCRAHGRAPRANLRERRTRDPSSRRLAQDDFVAEGSFIPVPFGSFVRIMMPWWSGRRHGARSGPATGS